MRRRPALLAAAALVAAALPCAPAAALTRCGHARCGSVVRPLERARPGGRKIRVGFRWSAPRGPGSGPPIVAVEGGPGYPSTGSRVEYLGTFGPLLKTRDLLLVDNRGTGASGAIDCPRVQWSAGRTRAQAFARRAARCGRTIEARFGRGAAGL